MYPLLWLVHRRVRKAAELHGIVQKHLDHQRDVLPEKSVAEIEAGLATFQAAYRHGGTSKDALKAAVQQMEDVAHKWLKPYPFASYRENFESFLGTAVLVFAFKTFFATPMEIPTGSAQPTFYGITADDLRDRPDVPIPTGLRRFWEKWAKGTTYYEVIAKADGELRGITQPTKQLGVGNLGFGKKIDVVVGDVSYPVAWVPESPQLHLKLYNPMTRQPYKASFKAGEPIIRCRVRSGDRLFVERLTYNFRKPRRGEYFVFQSTGMPEAVTPGTHYIKRLIAFGGEKVRIGDDRHVYINGRRLETTDPGFEKVYAFDPARTPADSVFSGHVNGTVYQRALAEAMAASAPAGMDASQRARWATDEASRMAFVTAYFPDGQTEYTVRANCMLGFGDNTMSSSDGRHWGDVPREKIIGKSWMVMWPFTDRWGW
jgi:signal peptidase I